ncbi:MAG: GTA-gp10 family protein [Pseudomonadota bacterium]
MSGLDPVVTIDGAPYRLRVTLGALAALEEAFDADLATLSERLARPRAADLLIVLETLIAGGGARVAVETLRASDLDLADAARAIGAAFAALEDGGAGGA